MPSVEREKKLLDRLEGKSWKSWNTFAAATMTIPHEAPRGLDETPRAPRDPKQRLQGASQRVHKRRENPQEVPHEAPRGLAESPTPDHPPLQRLQSNFAELSFNMDKVDLTEELHQ